MRVFFFLCFLFAFSLFARSSVWKVSDGRHTLYVGGAIHILRPSDYPLPDEFDQAYTKADYLVLEADVSQLQSPQAAAALVGKMFLPKGKTLSTLLKSSTYAELENYLRSQGQGIEKFERMEPWAVMLTLTQLQLSTLGINQDGVDSFYDALAQQEGKEERYLETIDEHIAIMTDMGKGEEDALITQTIRDTKELPQTAEWMVREWREGKTERMRKEFVEEMRIESPSLYRHVLSDRNNAWMPKLRAMMAENKTGFVLVGAMHLLGPEGLLEQFRKLGYRVDPY